MKNEAEKNVSEFYNTFGWQSADGVTNDASTSEDLRDCAKEYVSKCRLRVLRHIPVEGGDCLLDMASGPIQYREYLSFSENFGKRYCVDLARAALDGAKEKIGDRGIYLHGSFFDIELEENFFDCSISLHTIYHMDKDKQEDAVRKLLQVTKPGKPVIIVYSNPRTLLYWITSPLRVLRAVLKWLKRRNVKEELFFYRHPLGWWKRFGDAAEIELFPWRSFNSKHQKLLIPNNRVGYLIFKLLYQMEEKFPRFFVRFFEYPMIVLTKKS